MKSVQRQNVILLIQTHSEIITVYISTSALLCPNPGKVFRVCDTVEKAYLQEWSQCVKNTAPTQHLVDSGPRHGHFGSWQPTRAGSHWTSHLHLHTPPWTVEFDINLNYPLLRLVSYCTNNMVEFHIMSPVTCTYCIVYLEKNPRFLKKIDYIARKLWQ